MRVLVTGATGFIGSAVLARLAGEPVTSVRGAIRRRNTSTSGAVEQVIVGDLAADTVWSAAVEGMDTVVHTAARVHVMRDTVADPLSEFRRVNVEGTIALARQAADAGVRRFIFVSSIKVNGEGTIPGQPYHATDVPAPVDPYGISKLEAEIALRRCAAATGIELTVIRPVLVYGPGVKGNFRSMLSWLQRGLPLPLGAVDNLRSFVALDNLVDLIVTCVRHPAAVNRIFLVSDGEDLSTPELLRRAGAAVGRSPRLLPIPPGVLRGLATAAGKRSLVSRLCDSLQVDISDTRAILGWSPPVSVRDALEATAAHLDAHHG